MPDERTPVLTYAGAKDGRFRRGVPRRDLYAEDVARMDPALLKDLTGGDAPLYEWRRTEAAKAAQAGAPATAKAPKE